MVMKRYTSISPRSPSWTLQLWCSIQVSASEKRLNSNGRACIGQRRPPVRNVQVREGKSRNTRRAVPLTQRTHQILTDRLVANDRPFVFANDVGTVPRVSSLDHLHARI